MTQNILILRPDNGKVQRFTLPNIGSSTIGYGSKEKSGSDDIVLKEVPKGGEEIQFVRIEANGTNTIEYMLKKGNETKFAVKINGKLPKAGAVNLVAGTLIEIEDRTVDDHHFRYFLQFIQPKAQVTPPPPPKASCVEPRSSYLQFLPPIYDRHGPGAEGDLINPLLLIAETILTPLERMIAQIDCYCDPSVAPEALLPWLKSWIGLFLKDDLPVERSRQLLNRGAELYRWRGTKKGLQEYIELGTGLTPQIKEPGMPEVQASNEPLAPDCFRVIMTVPNDHYLDLELLWQILDSSKPAHTGYQLEVNFT